MPAWDPYKECKRLEKNIIEYKHQKIRVQKANRVQTSKDQITKGYEKTATKYIIDD